MRAVRIPLESSIVQHFITGTLKKVISQAHKIAIFVLHYRPQGKVMFSQVSISHSVHNWPHGYSVTTNPCHGAVGTHPTGMLSCYICSFLLYLNHMILVNVKLDIRGKRIH